MKKDKLYQILILIGLTQAVDLPVPIGTCDPAAGDCTASGGYCFRRYISSVADTKTEGYGAYFAKDNSANAGSNKY